MTVSGKIRVAQRSVAQSLTNPKITSYVAYVEIAQALELSMTRFWALCQMVTGLAARGQLALSRKRASQSGALA